MLGWVMASIAALPLACGEPTEGAGRPEPPKVEEPDDLCARATRHLTLTIASAGGGAPSPAERTVMEASSSMAAAQCRAEGLTAAQADCILAVGSMEELMALETCPAIAARRPSWLVLPPSAADRPPAPVPPSR